jgi:hypothetical protein
MRGFGRCGLSRSRVSRTWVLLEIRVPRTCVLLVIRVSAGSTIRVSMGSKIRVSMGSKIRVLRIGDNLKGLNFLPFAFYFVAFLYLG